MSLSQEDVDWHAHEAMRWGSWEDLQWYNYYGDSGWHWNASSWGWNDGGWGHNAAVQAADNVAVPPNNDNDNGGNQQGGNSEEVQAQMTNEHQKLVPEPPKEPPPIWMMECCSEVSPASVPGDVSPQSPEYEPFESSAPSSNVDMGTPVFPSDQVDAEEAPHTQKDGEQAQSPPEGQKKVQHASTEDLIAALEEWVQVANLNNSEPVQKKNKSFK